MVALDHAGWPVVESIEAADVPGKTADKRQSQTAFESEPVSAEVDQIRLSGEPC